MTVRVIDTIGQVVDFVTADHWSHHAPDDTIHIYDRHDIIAIVPGTWIVNVLPFSQVDPGAEGAD